VYSYLKNSKNPSTLPVKFLTVAIGAYFLNCVQGATQSIRAINDITHGTQWTIGHAHLALVGWISFGVFGMFYFLYPLVTKKRIYSERLAISQLWLALIGAATMWISLSIAGLTQGNILDSGLGFYAAREALSPYMFIRLFGGVAYAVSTFLFLYNAYATLRGVEAVTEPSLRPSARHA
jgi:cbb3-type cytochrome oxidase subunit 1